MFCYAAVLPALRCAALYCAVFFALLCAVLHCAALCCAVFFALLCAVLCASVLLRCAAFYPFGDVVAI
jgi:hypothetical protein